MSVISYYSLIVVVSIDAAYVILKIREIVEKVYRGNQYLASPIPFSPTPSNPLKSLYHAFPLTFHIMHSNNHEETLYISMILSY